MSENCPDTTTNESAKNPNGQRNSMKGTTGVFTPPNADMNTSKPMAVDPSGSLGHRRFDKD